MSELFSKPLTHHNSSEPTRAEPLPLLGQNKSSAFGTKTALWCVEGDERQVDIMSSAKELRRARVARVKILFSCLFSPPPAPDSPGSSPPVVDDATKTRKTQDPPPSFFFCRPGGFHTLSQKQKVPNPEGINKENYRTVHSRRGLHAARPRPRSPHVHTSLLSPPSSSL